MGLAGLSLLILASVSPTHASEPCCGITTIAGSLVTATETATGKTFQFQVNAPALAKSLRVGQQIYADFGTQQVSVDGGAPYKKIVAATGGATGGAPLPGVKLPTIHGEEPCCAVVANAALKGRMGRVVVAFPVGVLPKATRVAVLKDGKEVKAGFGSQSWEVLSGSYDVMISGKRVSNVTVQAGYDTQVKVGVLRVTAGKQTKSEVLDGGKMIASGHGDHLVGLPAGSYDLKVAGKTETITIQDGQITEF